jgi:hypothetical protein
VPLSDNVEKHIRARDAADDSIIRRMRIVCWITKATDTLQQSEYVRLLFHCNIAYRFVRTLRAPPSPPPPAAASGVVG